MSENTPPEEPNPPRQSAQSPGPHGSPEQGASWWQQGGHQPYGAGGQSAGHYPGQQPWHTMSMGEPYMNTAPMGGDSGQSPRGGRRVSKALVVTGVVAALVGGGIGVGGSALLSNNDSNEPVLTTSNPATGNSNDSNAKPGSVTYAAQVATKSTVDIKVAAGQSGAEGTGIVLTKDGYVLTNNHVVSAAGGASKIQITTADGNHYSASVKGTAPSYDLAVLKMDNPPKNLAPAALGTSSNLKVGQTVAAVGSPFGLTESVTSGIISALNRTVTTQTDNGNLVVYNGLQTDAAINEGNSGGPLVNMNGQVVGVNSAINTGGSGGSSSGSSSAGNIGIGYSIPIDTARRVANELIQNGQATKPLLGVTGTVTGNSGDGARISGVQDGGAAQKAGIKKGDVITKLGGHPISSYADLMAQVLQLTPGQKVNVTVKHSDGSTQTVQVTLGSTPDKQQTTVTPQQESPFGFGGGQGGGGLGGGGLGGGEGGGGLGGGQGGEGGGGFGFGGP